MGIQKEFTIRYRNDGHVRFEIPDQLCDAGIAKILIDRTLEIEGVYRVDLFKRQGKFSIRFQETVCDFKQLATQLFNLLSELDQQGLFAATGINEVNSAKQPKWSVPSKFKNMKASRWVNEKYTAIKETAQAAKVITKLGLKKPKSFISNPEKAMIDFFNDILVLYLIKLHWVRITQEWLPKPWQFRYQWTAVFYLFYLLIRSRKPK